MAGLRVDVKPDMDTAKSLAPIRLAKAGLFESLIAVLACFLSRYILLEYPVAPRYTVLKRVSASAVYLSRSNI